MPDTPHQRRQSLLFGPRSRGAGAQPRNPDRLKHAVFVPNVGNFGLASDLVDFAEIAWNCGWDGFFIWDHLVFGGANTADPAVTLGAIAQSSLSWRRQAKQKAQSVFTIGVLVTPVPRRRAWKLAKEIATVATLLDATNRQPADRKIELVWGFGLGVEEDYLVTGEPEQTTSQRAAQTDEGIRLIRRLLAGGEHDFRPLPDTKVQLWSALSWVVGKALGDHPAGPARRAAGLDGVFPVPLPWPDPWERSSELTPGQIKELSELITQLQEGQEIGADGWPVDLAACGQSNRTGPDARRGRDAGYREAGLTWWLELAQPNDELDSTKKWIEAGPVEDF